MSELPRSEPLENPPAQPRPAQSALARVRWALFAGAAGAAFSALGEFGASWLWLPVWRDRAGLLLRLLATLVPVGAGLAALATGAFALSLQLVRRSSRPQRALCLLWALLAAPLARLLAIKLCSG